MQNLFVRFQKDDTALGFTTSITYPVYQIDCYENNDGLKVTEFLLANSRGEFHWINAGQVRRSNPEHSKPTSPEYKRFDAQRPVIRRT
jgi:hypothetical protein